MPTSDPIRVGDTLAAKATELAAKFAHRATEDSLNPDDYDTPEMAAYRAEGMEALRAHRWSMVVPSRFLWATVASFNDPAQVATYQPTVAGDLQAWADAPAGRNLVLLGPVGVGKTHAAVAAARVRYDHGAEVRFYPVGELLDLLRPGGPEHAFEALADVDVLVLDDLGSERATDWTAERLYLIINRRWLEERPTIATSNLPATRRVAPEGYLDATLDEVLGARTFSRLVGSGAAVVKLAGTDRRRLRP